MPTLFEVHEVAQRLRIGRSHVYALLANGELPSYKIGRRRLIDARDVDAMLQRNRTGGPVLTVPASR